MTHTAYHVKLLTLSEDYRYILCANWERARAQIDAAPLTGSTVLEVRRQDNGELIPYERWYLTSEPPR